MAMLAEPRRKQQLSNDPRNRMWSDDQNKFGHRMLEKMGWKNGKGLGAKEDGKTDYIKVSFKNNTLGVGCSASHEDNWIAHQDDFNDILATLNQDHSKVEGKDGDKKETADKTSKSLEERSKKSKSRVHYKKFTRGKDLSKYGATNINCILGVRANKSASSTLQTQSINKTEADDDVGEEREENDEKEDASHGITTITNCTSIQDYFAKKMAELKKVRQSHQQNPENDKEDRQSTEESKQGSDSVQCKDRKCKKKKKNKKKDLDDNHGNQDCDASHLELEMRNVPLESKKISKRKQRYLHDSDNDKEGVGQGDKSSSSYEAQGSDGSPRKKKCKGKSKGEDLEAVTIGDSNEQIATPGDRKKWKKKKKSKSIDN